MNLLLIEPKSLQPGLSVRLNEAQARHVVSILKVQPGDSIRIGLLDGPLGHGTVTRIGKDIAELACAFDDGAPSRPRVDVLLALPRPKVMRRLWAQLSALGVGRIILTNAWKVEKMYFDSHVLQPEIYRPLLIEGLQQAGDTRMPEVRIFKQFKILVEDELNGLSPDSLRLVAQPGEGTDILDAVLAARPGRVLLAVGPEGGWIPYEEELLAAHGFMPVSMGARPLRTDTACLALLSLLHAAM